MPTIETRKTKIKNIFKTYISILDSTTQVIPRSSSGKDKNVIFVPGQVSYDKSNDGLPLKGGVGFLSIMEEVNNNGDVLGYLYRFTSDEYTYLAGKNSPDSNDWMKDGFFNFHYQKDERHDGPHFSFLHPSIQYTSCDISLEAFLNFIERTFFVDGLRKTSLPWHSRF